MRLIAFAPEGLRALNLVSLLFDITDGPSRPSRLAICGKIQQNVILPHSSAVVCLALSTWKR